MGECTSGHEWEILSLSKGNIECFFKRGADGSSLLDKALVCEVNSCWCIHHITHLVYEVNMLIFWRSLGAVVIRDHYNSWDWEEVMLPIKCQSPPGYCVLFPLLLLLWWFRIIKLQAQESPGLLILFCLFPHPDFLNIFLMKMRLWIKSLKQTVRPHPAAPWGYIELKRWLFFSFLFFISYSFNEQRASPNGPTDWCATPPLNLDEPLEEFIHSLKFASFKGQRLLRRLWSDSTVGTEGHSFT